jgi:hypothetical protein
VLELRLRVAQIGAPGGDPRGEDLVMERRDEHLDALRVDDAHAVEQVLLGEQLRRVRALGRAAGELVDELVDTGRADGAGRRADDHLPPRELHQALGLIRTSDASSCFK